MDNRFIKVFGARENNLKNLTFSVPKGKITAFTGVSGSGKSSLVLDTIAALSRRELNETFPSFAQQFLPKYGIAKVDSIENLPIAIVIDQKKPSPNARSTVGTYTDIFSLLRLLFSRAGTPFIGYSDTFSFNHPKGKCERCDGLGEINEIDIHKLVDFNKSLNENDVIRYDVAFQPGLWRWKRYGYSGLFDLDKKIKDYSEEELRLFLYSPQIRLKNPPQNWPKSAKFEGLVPRMYRSVVNSDEGKLHRKLLEPMLVSGVCPDCGGTRLNARVRGCKINDTDISEAAKMPLTQLIDWLGQLQHPTVGDTVRVIVSKLRAMIDIGLSYITLDRSMNSLSGGEAQRCKIAKFINSPISDVMYVLDEPSVGLHSLDIEALQASVNRLKKRGNTVLLVEHNRQMISAADYVIDLGPGAGALGGEIVYSGDFDGLLAAKTETAAALTERSTFKANVRKPTGWFNIKNANLHNLKGFDIDLPLGVMAVIAGVAGSGKSSLMEVFRSLTDESIVYISQKNIGVSLRSTPATYLDVADEIRKIFAKASGKPASLFSFNGKGACPVCGGKGVIISDMAFMDSIETTCEACRGLRYSDDALTHSVNGLNIAQVMDLSVSAAIERFADTVISQRLAPLAAVGLQYLHLNQALSTLSGGELQRLKLASYLNDTGKIFILDEPCDGLHTKDIRNIIGLFDSLVNAGNSLFLVEHSLTVLKAADYCIELGPGGGQGGGHLLYCGRPEGLLTCEKSVTRPFLTDRSTD